LGVEARGKLEAAQAMVNAAFCELGAACPKVKDLVDDTFMTWSALDWASSFPNLTSLDLINSSDGDAVVPALSSRPKVKNLRLRGGDTDFTVAKFKEIINSVEGRLERLVMDCPNDDAQGKLFTPNPLEFAFSLSQCTFTFAKAFFL
jgi:hypothetical protein